MSENKITQSKTFCPHSWLSATHTNGGFYKPCCVYNRMGDNSNKWANGFERNSTSLNRIRKEMIEEKHPAQCIECWRTEQKGLPSLRTETLRAEWWKPYEAMINGSTGDGGEFSQSPIYLDLKLGNKCNLACRMCHAGDSSLIQKEIENNPNDFDDREHQELEWLAKHSLTDDDIDDVFDQIRTLDRIVNIKFTGGEPFLNQRIPEFIDYCVNSGLSQQMNIMFTTNLTTIPEKVLPKLEKFHSSSICVSMEGVNEVYEYIRWPASWRKFESNFDKLSQHDINIDISFTIHALNVFYMPDWLAWQTIHGTNWNPNIVWRPNFYNISVLPDELKQEINQRFNDAKFQWPGFRKQLDGILDLMNTSMPKTTDRQVLWDSLVRDTLIKDRLRGQSIHKSLPEIGNFMPVDKS